MTLNARTLDYPSALPADVAERRRTPALPAEPFVPDSSDRRIFTFTMLLILALYLLLQNRYWVPAGDSELYTAAARSLARGEGYRFNDQPVAIIPPGWSWMMSMVMRITPYFLPLKLLAMSCVIGSLACGYWVLRRFAPPREAALAIIMTALLSHVYQATYWLISEGSFCLVSTASILLAMQVREGKREGWRIALMLAMCAAAVTIRWAGVFGMFIVLAALLEGEWKPRFSAKWIAAAMVVVVTLGTFGFWRHALRMTAEEQAAANDEVTGTGEDMGEGTIIDTTGPPITGTANQSAKTYDLFPKGSYIDRFLNWGRWFSYLFWQPLRAGASRWVSTFATVIGWFIIALLGVVVVVAVKRRSWVWLATAGYTGVLALGWTNVNARYFVPIAFLLTLGVILAARQLIEWSSQKRGWRVAAKVGLYTFIIGTIVCNAALYAVEMSIARSNHFYERYETGLDLTLISAVKFAMAQPDSEHRMIGVSPRYTNLGKAKASPFALRATVLLSDREVVTPALRYTGYPPTYATRPTRNLWMWMRRTNVRYYLYQPAISPWRVWHFRMGWYEKMVTGFTAQKDESAWQVYRFEDDGTIRQVSYPITHDYPTRVPGL